jgi:membrane protein YdbS with pleckstrin-like domain
LAQGHNLTVMDDLFAPPAYEWQRLAPSYLSLRRVADAIGWLVLFSIAAVLVLVFTDLWWLAVLIWVACLVVIGLRFHFLRRSCASWGYVERDEDLYITHGVWFRTLTAVPYGRMQLVEVESGPLERMFHLASVTLKTASPGTDARIPGLSPEEAARLRDQLTQLGEAHASGL